MNPDLTLNTSLPTQNFLGQIVRKDSGAIYVAKKKLGKGSWGDVYLVDSPKGGEYAMKIHKEKCHLESQKEAQMLKMVQPGPHLVKFFSDFEVSSISGLEVVANRSVTDMTHQHAILLEVLGQDMHHKYLDLGPGRTPTLSSKQICSIARQTLETLRYLKTVGCIHGDLKPDNLVYNEMDDTLTISDFSNSNLISAEIDPNIMTQCAYYRAPEQMLCTPYTTSIDMWSLGLICFELYTGRRLLADLTTVNHTHA
jgi:serine/threonine protein kinase